MNKKEILLKIKKEMEKCNHLFVKQEEGYWIEGFHSSDYEYTPCTVKCLKCGLTNYHNNMDIVLRDKYSKILKIMFPSKYYWYLINDEIFKKQYNNINKKELENKLNLISNERFNALNPIKYYKLANKLKPNANNEEIFNIMKELYENDLKLNHNKVKSKVKI